MLRESPGSKSRRINDEDSVIRARKGESLSLDFGLMEHETRALSPQGSSELSSIVL